MKGGETDASNSQISSIPYDVVEWSSHSGSYHPRNILVNRPTDQSSRWSTSSNNQMQYLTIKLESAAIVHSITFGKYHKVHVCNLKEFKVFGGMNNNNMIELLHSGLHNNDEAETLPLKHKINGVEFPCQFIKILPIAAWGSNFNFSIWYVRVNGEEDASRVSTAQDAFMQYRENEAIRLCMKHCRQRNYLDTLESLKKRTKLELEHPLLTELHSMLVVEGNFSRCEEILTEACSRGMFETYTADCKYSPKWLKLENNDTALPSPGMRGGHQMIIDVEMRIIYLLGGWDGSQDLGDFWSFNIETGNWHCISQNTQLDGGPEPRSCHKIAFDTKMRRILVLGKFVDAENRDSGTLGNFFSYSVDSNTWTKLSDDTSKDDGPLLIYDHQMIVDSEDQLLYVFGGRVIAPSAPEDSSYSGLYRYNLATGQWTLLRKDADSGTDACSPLKSRIGHSMLLHPDEKKLYIFAGQRHKDYLSDFYLYDVTNDVVEEICRDSSKFGGPDAGFTQRATMDASLGEIYVLSGLMREKDNSQETVKNSFWVYSIARNKWKRVYENEHTDHAYWSKMQSVEPCPRFAHQLVYDSVGKKHYVFGGNPGESFSPAVRLDDFWSLDLDRPTQSYVLKRSQFLVRKQKFQELCAEGKSLEALTYLQQELSATVNHDNEAESAEFRDLTASLFPSKKREAEDPSSSTANVTFHQRTALYETLLAFFPPETKQPEANLIDLLPAY